MALALAEGKPQQTHENRQVVAAARFYGQGLFNQYFQQFFERIRLTGHRLATIQLAFQAGTEAAEKAREDCLNQRLFRTEVIVHRRQVYACLAGDQAKRSLSEAFFSEQLLRCVQNALDCLGLRHAPSNDKHLFETYVSANSQVNHESGVAPSSSSHSAPSRPNARRTRLPTPDHCI